jgi:hypothetical protein
VSQTSRNTGRHINAAPRQKKNASQNSGEKALMPGIYAIEHSGHMREKQVFIPEGTCLPACPACGGSMKFHLVEQVDHISHDPDFRME